MSSNWETLKVQDILYTTDYVANGSFASIKENVKYVEVKSDECKDIKAILDDISSNGY